MHPDSRDDKLFEFFATAVNLNRLGTEVILGTIGFSVGKASSHQLLLSLKQSQSLEMSAVGRYSGEGDSSPWFSFHSPNFAFHSPSEISVNIHGAYSAERLSKTFSFEAISSSHQM